MIINVVNYNSGTGGLPPAPSSVTYNYETFTYKGTIYYLLNSIDCSGYNGTDLTIPETMVLDGTNERPVMFNSNFFSNSSNLWGSVTDLYIGFRPIINRGTSTTLVQIKLPPSIKNLHLYNPFPTFTNSDSINNWVELSWFSNCENVFFPENFNLSYLSEKMFLSSINASLVLSNIKFNSVTEIKKDCFYGATFSPNYEYNNENLTTIGENAFRDSKNLEKFIAPNCISANPCPFRDSLQLKYIDIGIQSIPQGFAENTSGLETLILRNTNGVVSVYENNFRYTLPGTWNVYVPDNLYNNYLNDSLWSTISSRIHKISELR